MKKIVFIIILIAVQVCCHAQDITGRWAGSLNVNGKSLSIVFNISKGNNGFTATMDSPDQHINGIPVTAVDLDGTTVSLKISNANIIYSGKSLQNTIEGFFKQGTSSLPLTLIRTLQSPAVAAYSRPQEPKAPFPYISEEVSFKNESDTVTLSGTLTLPKKEGKFPVIVLITGSGPQNRDEEILGHKPFLVISDYLTRNGFAVLRYDDRGTGKSTGNFKAATSQDFAADAASAVKYLRSRNDIDKKNIGLLGHSEGGIIAQMIAADDNKIAFMILMAGPAVPGDALLLAQLDLIAVASGMAPDEIAKGKQTNEGAFEIIKQAGSGADVKKELEAYFLACAGGSTSNVKSANAVAGQFATRWMQYFVKYNPRNNLLKVKCPVLALNGSNDLQVPAIVNLAALQSAFKTSKNEKLTVKEYAGLNHLFQESVTGLPSEYETISQTISPAVLTDMLQWLNTTTK